MAGFTEYPQKYQLYTAQTTKTINVVLCIDGLDFCFGSGFTYTVVRYGDPGLFYGQPGLVYGALRLNDSVKPWLMFDSALSLSQRLEPEQGRASISQFNFSLIDKDGQVSRVIATNGGYLSEILGRGVVVKIGYVQTSFPEDYWTAFRGLITNVVVQAGKVIFTVGDPNQKRRTMIFRNQKTRLNSPITAFDTLIPVYNTAGFYNLTVDQSAFPYAAWNVRPYLKIEDEYIGYGYGAITPTDVTVLGRGGSVGRGTTPQAYAAETEVTHAVELQDNALTMALKIMLSGWNGPWLTGLQCTALGTVYDFTVPPASNVIVLLPGVNASLDLGLVPGDSITVSGSTAGNDGTYVIVSFGDAEGFPNRLIYIDTNLALENPAPTVELALRSQYDVYPESIGLKLPADQVDVATHEYIRDTLFNSPEYTLRIFMQGQTTGKEFIEKECYLPTGCFSLTRYGRLSIGLTLPPLVGQNLVKLDNTNVINPELIQEQRGLNNRTFYNQVQYEYDKNDSDEFEAVTNVLDTDSLNEIGLLSLLPIRASGVRSEFGGGILASRISNRIMSRFKKGAYTISLSSFWNPGTYIEAGDAVLLADNGNLKITNLDTGVRNIGEQLYQVTDRTLDIKTGQVRLVLTSGLSVTLTDRYAGISPSSLIQATGTTTTKIKLKPSFGNTSVETTKWKPFQNLGLTLLIHSYDYSFSEERTYLGIDPVDPTAIVVTPALSLAPGEDYIVDIAYYPFDTDPALNLTWKNTFVSIDPSVPIVSGTSNFIFDVSAPDATKFVVGQLVSVHNADYSLNSPESTIVSVVGTTVTVDVSLGFTPAAGQTVELIGFIDGGGAFRIL